MTITAKNYVAQAQRGLLETASLAQHAGHDRDAGAIREFADQLSDAVHFVIPDDAQIFDDNLKGISGDEIHLPFPEITIEYFVNDFKVLHELAPVASRKRVIHAAEMPPGRIPEDDRLNKGYLLIRAAHEVDGAWIPFISGIAVPTAWDSKDGCEEGPRLYDYGNKSPSFSGVRFGFCADVYEELCAERGEDVVYKNVMHDIVGEVRALLEFCEAMSCSNVDSEPIERISKEVNDRRVRAGKLPLYETRRLVLKLPNRSTSTNSSADNTQGRSAPREHLRRGHIRRLESKNVWVNSCVVGSRANGIIEKSYAVKATK